MNKYDKMIEENQKKSKEKIELAQRTIQDMISNKERISVPKLMKKTGLSRGFFYKNPNCPGYDERGDRATGRDD